jgi:hypothetical protein
MCSWSRSPAIRSGSPSARPAEARSAAAPERDGQGDVLGSAPQAVFLPAAVDDWFEVHSVAHVQRRGALGGVQQVHAELADVEGDLPGCLGGVAADEHAAVAGQGGQFPDGLDGTGLVVGGHH